MLDKIRRIKEIKEVLTEFGSEDPKLLAELKAHTQFIKRRLLYAITGITLGLGAGVYANSKGDEAPQPQVEVAKKPSIEERLKDSFEEIAVAQKEYASFEGKSLESELNMTMKEIAILINAFDDFEDEQASIAKVLASLLIFGEPLKGHLEDAKLPEKKQFFYTTDSPKDNNIKAPHLDDKQKLLHLIPQEQILKEGTLLPVLETLLHLPEIMDNPSLRALARASAAKITLLIFAGSESDLNILIDRLAESCDEDEKDSHLSLMLEIVKDFCSKYKLELNNDKVTTAITVLFGMAALHSKDPRLTPFTKKMLGR